LNNPVKYTDPSGHWADEDKKVHASSCTPWPVCIFNGRQLATQPDPWSPAVDTLQDEAEYKQLSKSAEQLFRENLESPWAGEFGPFGGPNSLTLNKDERHPAVDSRGSRLGAPIHAAAYGKVVSVGDNGNTDFGKYVLIEHDVYGDKYYSVYAHLNAQYVAQGDIVDDTTAIGAMGESGTNNIHLHFEVRKATNVDLTQDNPFQGQVWWPQTWTSLTSNFVNLGVIYGYASDFFTWKENHP
jgi:murein DD-endopeptidase MepM/ murein hydrolase activator NlpD